MNDASCSPPFLGCARTLTLSEIACNIGSSCLPPITAPRSRAGWPPCWHDAPVRRLLIGLTLAAVLASALSSPSARPSAGARVNRFDERAAWTFLRRQVELGPRPAGSAASAQLAEILRASIPRGRYQTVPGGLRNVVGTVRRTQPAPRRRRRRPLRHEGPPRLRRRERRRLGHGRRPPARAHDQAAAGAPDAGLRLLRRGGVAAGRTGRRVRALRAPRQQGRGPRVPAGRGRDRPGLRRRPRPGDPAGADVRSCALGEAPGGRACDRARRRLPPARSRAWSSTTTSRSYGPAFRPST